jgi:hypothetical protein
MLDVHPPHTPTHTFRDFLLHIATIVVGLLIAVGLEQTVEYLHHRHQVTEAREALRLERQENYKLFALETRSFNLATPYLQKDVEILLYLRSHPHASSQSWPGVIVWPSGEVPFVSAAWSTVQRDGVIELLPQLEVERLDELYKRLDRVRFEELAERDLAQQAGGRYTLQPDLANLEPRDLDKLLDLTTQLLITHAKIGSEQNLLTARFHDFPSSPSIQTVRQIFSAGHFDPAGFAANKEINREFYAITGDQSSSSETH